MKTANVIPIYKKETIVMSIIIGLFPYKYI